MLYTKFEKLKEMAKQNPGLRKELLESAQGQNPLSSFCSIARRQGCEIYPMDIIGAGEEYYAAMKRSTNGGGENSHKHSGWDNYFQMLVHEL